MKAPRIVLIPAQSKKDGDLISLTASQRKIFAVTWITYAGFYFCRKNLSIVLPVLQALRLGSMDLANIVFGYSLMYSLGQFGCGFLSDVFGPRGWSATGLVLVGGSNLLMGFTLRGYGCSFLDA